MILAKQFSFYKSWRNIVLSFHPSNLSLLHIITLKRILQILWSAHLEHLLDRTTECCATHCFEWIQEIGDIYEVALEKVEFHKQILLFTLPFSPLIQGKHMFPCVWIWFFYFVRPPFNETTANFTWLRREKGRWNKIISDFFQGLSTRQNIVQL